MLFYTTLLLKTKGKHASSYWVGFDKRDVTWEPLSKNIQTVLVIRPEGRGHFSLVFIAVLTPPSPPYEVKRITPTGFLLPGLFDSAQNMRIFWASLCNKMPRGDTGPLYNTFSGKQHFICSPKDAEKSCAVSMCRCYRLSTCFRFGCVLLHAV